MKTLHLLLALLLAATSHAQISSVLEGELNKSFNDIVSSYSASGVAAAIQFNDGSTWTSAYGQYGTQYLSTDLLYEAGSNTKTMIAALVLLLEEEGKLSIDDSLAQYIVPGVNVDGGITIKQLLNHTSGLANFTDHPDYYPFINNNWNTFLPVDSVLVQFVGKRRFVPGKRMEYSNTGYLLLGKIIEAVDGKDLAASLRDRLFEPLGLDNTYLAYYEDYNQLHLGTWFGNNYDPEQPVSFLSSAWAAGAVICEPQDLAKWAYQLYSGNVLSETSMQKMKETVPYEGGSRYGLGMIKRSIFGKTYFGHGGRTLQSSSMDYSVEGDYSIVFMNIDGKNEAYSETQTMRSRMIQMLEKRLVSLSLSTNATITKEDVIKIYPMPAVNEVTLEYTNSTGFDYQIINAKGQVIKAGQSTGNKQNIQRSAIGSGLFWVRVSDNNGLVSTKPIQFR